MGSICSDGSSIEASIHWIDHSRTSNNRPYDVFCYRVATGCPHAATLLEFQETYRKFANFLDWMKEVRLARLKEVQEKFSKDPTLELDLAVQQMCQEPETTAAAAIAIANIQDTRDMDRISMLQTRRSIE